MLVVSRAAGESLVVAGSMLLTVVVVGRDFVDLGLSDLYGRRLRVVTLSQGVLLPVALGVRGVFIEPAGRRVRLGFECPPGISIRRRELPADNDSLTNRGS